MTMFRLNIQSFSRAWNCSAKRFNPPCSTTSKS